MSDSSGERYVIQARLLGLDDSANKKRRRKSEKEFAIDVTLSDESSFVIFRTVKEITTLHTKLMAQFPVEAGYFDKKETVIPDCPLKMTIFGPSRIVQEDRVFEKLLNSYIKELPGMPPSIVKCDLLNKFFKLRPTDMSEPGKSPASNQKRRRKSAPVIVTADSKITGPMRLRSYYAVAAYSDSKTKFSFAEGAVIQVLQKDPSGWWMVDVSGVLGWAPASYLVPVDDGELADDAKENEKLISSMRVGARYISMSAYQASRDDEVSFVSGAIVRLIKKYADGWWLVRYNGGEGFVPGSMFRKFDRRQGTAYVKNIQRKFRNRKSTKIIPTIKPKWMTDPNPGASGLMLYQCLIRYRGSESSEISLNKDDIVKVLDKKDHGWWYVEDRHSRTGWAPATYLGPVVDRAKKSSNPRQNSVVGSTHEVREAYSAQQSDELSVHRGDKVTVLSAPDDGWWVVCNMSNMEQGLIPSVCLNDTATIAEEEPSSELLESIKALEVQEDQAEDEDENTDQINGEEEDDDEHDNFDSSISDSEMGGDDVLLDGNCYIATTNYTRQAQDELSMTKGQAVYVVDDSDKSMYYVTVDGKEGWVPSDILKITSARSSVSSVSSYSRRSHSRSPTHSRSVSPSPLQSRSPSPMEMYEITHTKPSLPHQHIHPVIPSRTFLSPTHHHSAALRTQSLDDNEVTSINKTKSNSSVVQIQILEKLTATDEDASVEDIEQAALEAERMAQEAQRKAAELRERAQKARRLSHTSSD